MHNHQPGGHFIFDRPIRLVWEADSLTKVLYQDAAQLACLSELQFTYV
jgi:hypothetical protein